MESKALNRTVRITLSDAEVQVRVSNLTLKNLLVLVWNFAEKNKKIQGALNLAKALKKTRDIRVFTMTTAQFQQFRREARQRKILCSYVWDKSGGAKSINIDVLLPATELKQASLIFKQMAYGLTDVRDVKTEITSEQTPPQPEAETASVQPETETTSGQTPTQPEAESASVQPEMETSLEQAPTQPEVETASVQPETETTSERTPTQAETASPESSSKEIRGLKPLSTERLEIGSVEPDMREIKARDRRDGANAFYIADYALRKYPLAGQYIPTPKEESLLYQRAQQAVEKILNDQPINNGDAAVLVVETANRLKSWDNVSEKQDSFWRYIFRQYGFQAERFGKAKESLLYEKFRMAIDRAFDRKLYNRFAVSDGHRYYATLLLHALAPKRSIENFFDILFSFYAENLDFQYVSGDSSYHAFIRGMQARWDAETDMGDTRLRSLDVLVGLKTLFTDRPGYMVALCDSLVRKMDALIGGENTLDTERDYWDYLLYEWYRKKSAEERRRNKDRRRKQRTEDVAVSKERILARYAMKKRYGEEEAVVGLSLPKIRLSEAQYENPVIRIYQRERLIYTDKLSVAGNDLCLTTRGRFFPLDEIGYDFSDSSEIRLEIDYLGEALYRSGERLSRPYIFFDDNGNEQPRPPETGSVWLFTGSGAFVAFDNEDGAYQAPGAGQLFRINLGEVSAVTVDGREIFANRTALSRFRCYPFKKPLRYVRAALKDGVCDIFDEAFSLSLRLPEGDNAARYRISLDGENYMLGKWERDGNEIVMTLPDAPEMVHSLKAIDFATGYVKFEYRYLILPMCGIGIDRPIYREAVDAANVVFTWNGRSETFSMPIPSGADSVSLTLPGLEIPIEADVPVIHATFMGESAFLAPDMVWHKQIPKDEFVTLRLPDGWEGHFMLGVTEIPPAPRGGQFELGNELRSGASRQETEPLWLSLKQKNGGVTVFQITDIIFRAHFNNAPLCAEEGKLRWQTEENYIGDEGSRFVILLTNPDGTEKRFEAGTTDAVLTEDELPDGLYAYSVFLKPQSVFSSRLGEPIYEGSLFIGDFREIAFENKELRLYEARCWNWREKKYETMSMRPGCGVLRDFAYQGMSVASGEEEPAPEYAATLYYTVKNGRLLPFSDRENAKFDPINPVKVWIVNEHLLILLCSTDDGIYLDRQSASIFKWKPDILHSDEQTRRLETPDYFSYQIREA